MTGKVIALIALLCAAPLCSAATQFELSFARSTNKVVVTDYYYMLEYSVVRDDRRIQSVTLGTGPGGFVKARRTPNGLILSGRGDEIEFTIEADGRDYSQLRVSRRNIGKSTSDCFNLHGSDEVNWFGGNQQRGQYYPIQKITHRHNSYLTKEEFNQAIAERYWLSSSGLFIHVDDDAPLFIDQNHDHPGYMCLQARRALPYDIHHTSFDFTYHVGIGLNARDTHRQAIARFLGKPTGHPDERMVREPVWSTWARYKVDVNEAVVTQFANEILDNGFKGQFELDDDWEECYGALTFNTNANKFPNIKKLTDSLHEKGFRVTLWVHPFINVGCEKYFNDAKSKGRLVADQNGDVRTEWWNSKRGEAGYIDFTKTETANWFYDHLKALQTSAGIDSYKFDAGESSWTPPDPKLNSTSKQPVHKIVADYVRTCARFGSLVEVRSGQSTQNLPVFVRMIDKDTEWTLNNGLPTLITTLLQLNMVGYGMVLPDMIGGNGYNGNTPDEEIFLRWLQANAFMPSLQFSYVPWDYSAEAIAISHKFVDLHEQYTPYIMDRFKLAVSSGEPVNPPIWWIAPEDKIAQAIDDEFLLGEKILVAPIIKQGATSRDVYLPAGDWTDGNSGETYNTRTGRWIRNYPAPIDTLPFFIKN